MEELVTKACYFVFGANKLFTGFLFFIFLSIFYWFSKQKYIKSWFLFAVSVSPIIIWTVRLLLNDYFLSDDFDHFVLVNKYSYWEIFLKGVMADNLWAFHRLFTAFEIFKILNTFFGINYNGYLIFNSAIHITNAYLLYLLLKKSFNDRYIRYLGVFIYSTFFLTWISNIHELLAGFFFLFTFNLLINKKSVLLTIVTLVLGIYSKEIVFLLPVCYFLFLIFLQNTKLKINVKNELKRIKPIIVLSLIYLIIFIFDYFKFSKFEKGSGYDLVISPINLYNHLSFYINDLLPFVYGQIGTLIFTGIIFVHDYIKKKVVLIPLFISYLILIFPVLSLNKNTSYYNYLPNIFIIFILVYMFSYFKKLNPFLNIVLASLFLVFGLNINRDLQENCFLIRFPRESARKQAIENVLRGKTDESDEAKWFINNNYKFYFK